MKASNLPPLILFSDHGGDWNKYLDVLYQFFKEDFINNRPNFQGEKLALKRHPLYKNKEATFWHIISSGNIEDDRLPDFRRCERIKWPKPIIENIDVSIKVWSEERRDEERIHLFFQEASYLVVLAKRKTYLLLWTAYPIMQEHQKNKLIKRWETAKKAGHAI